MKKKKEHCMKKLKFLSAAMAAVVLATSIALPASASTSAASLAPVKTAPITDSTLTAGKFNIIEDTFQYGIDVTRLIVNLGTEVPYNAVDSDTFTVKAKTFTSDTKQQVFPDLDSKDDFYNTTAYDAANPDGIRYTVGVYVCDKDGNQLKKGTGSYAMINLAHGMYQNGASDNHRNNGCPAAIYEGLYCHSLVLNYSISQNKPIKGIDSTLTFTQNATINPEADCWDAGTTADLRYRAYAPTNDGKKHPLIIWLHGAGEGGPEEGMQIKANWVTSFSDAIVSGALHR
jgi:predicted peptidase